MKRHILFVWVVFFLSLNAFGQNEASQWIFGNKAGISFLNNPASTFSVNGFNAPEGSASISSATGQLLFYTDGVRVYSADNKMMPNGNSLLGDPSTTQSSIIVPRPNYKGHYYVFTLDDGGRGNGLTYSEVDMNLNHGLGDVTSIKNVSLKSPLAEKLTAIRHHNGTDYWVLVHGIDNTNKNRFFAYKITESGPSSTVVTTDIGSSHNIGFGGSFNGYMKFSPNGKKVACAVGGTGSFLEIFDFDDNDGTLSNPMRVDFSTSPYGVEFSPDSKRLYVSAGSYIYQYTLPETKNLSLLLFSEQKIASDANVWALQLGINYKIFVCKQGGKLGVINAPNNDASTIDFIDNVFDLEANTYATQGLPNFMPHYLNDELIGVENLCVGRTTYFTVLLNGLDSVTWNFGDNFVSNILNKAKGFTPSYSYSASGFYTVSATIYVNGIATLLTRKIFINPLPVFSLGNDTILCKGQALNVNLNVPSAVYLWNDDSKQAIRNITTPGIHFVDVTTAGCTVRDSVKITYDLVKSGFQVNKPTQCLSNNEFNFTSNESDITQNLWLYNDTVLGSDASLKTSFSAPGFYNVIHVATSANNCVDSSNIEVKVYKDIKAEFEIIANENCGPANNFDFIDKSIYVGTYTSSYEVEGRTIPKSNLNWNFTSEEGEYIVKYTVTTDEGCSNAIEKQVIVYKQPESVFAIVSQKSCSNDHLVIVKKITPLTKYESITWFAGNVKVKGDETMQVSIPTPGKHTIKAVISNPGGCTSVYEQEIEVFASPVADFTTSENTVICLGNKDIQFVNNSKTTLSITEYLWDFGDNTTSAKENPTKDYLAQADYIVSLTVFNEKGCTSTSTQTLNTYEKPDTRISANILSHCLNDNSYEVSFRNVNPAATITNYLWRDETGKEYNANPLPVNFTNAGEHTLKLIVNTSNGCQDSGYTTLKVFENPTGTIVFDKTELCLGEDFGFSVKLGSSCSPISKYVWDLGNGNTAEGPAVVSKYNKAGNYSVNVSLIDQYGCKASFESVDILVHPSPTFQIVNVEACVNEPVKMKITGLDNFISVNNWLWDLGDGSLANKPEPEHSFKEAGSYTVTASVTSDWGCRYQTTNSNAVTVHELPSVDFSYQKSQWGFDETVVEFDAQASTSIVKYAWDFGNGHTSNNESEKVRFDKAGYYNISLSVTNDKNCSSTIQKDVLVVPPFDAYVPTAFTPNGDGKNDEFGMEGVQFIKTFKMQVFNRWGQQIFVTENVNVKWDGRSNGMPMPLDVYSYLIKLTDADGRPYSLSGTIELIR